MVHDELGSNGDEMVQKLQAVIGSDAYPDIAYVYGSDVPNVSQSSKVVDISKDIKATGFAWNSLYRAGRETATVGSKIVGFPAVIDNLAVVYNTKILKAAGVAPPKPGWTWDDYRALAKKLTNPAKDIYGTGYPVSGSEDTTWRLWPMIWQQGGEVLDGANKKALFGGAQGVKALQLLSDMALKDKSLYPDQTPDTQKMYGLFNSGKMAMIVTGPWQLPDIRTHHVSYGVQVLPSFGGSHETISGPDVYMVFNHSDERRKAAVTFLAWLHQPAQDLQWDIGSGNLPLSAKTAALPGIKQFDAKYPGIDLFVKNLAERAPHPSADRCLHAGLDGGRQGDRHVAARPRQPQGHAGPGGQGRRQGAFLSRGDRRAWAPAPACVAAGTAREHHGLVVRAARLGARARARVLPGDLVVPALDQGQ